MFSPKNPFFQNSQNEVIKCFQTVSIQKKMLKIDRTHYKKKLLSPKFFSKNQNRILKSRPKFSNFQKMAILRKWKYPIFVPKVHKIKKLRQLFLSKCPENNFKTFHFDVFLHFFDFFLKFKKKRGKNSGQNHKMYKIETIFDFNFERFKMVFWKIFQRRKIFILLFFFHFLLFFWFMNTQKAQKLEQIMRILSSSKRNLCKKCWIGCKNSTNVAKTFSNNSLVPCLFPNFFSGCYINMFWRKTSENLSK